MKTTEPLIIAEAGVNHNGSLELALEMVDAAVDAGADAVKFQVFNTERVISRHAAKADYQKRTTEERESLLEMGRRLELSRSAFETLYGYCKRRGMMFLASPFDEPSLHFLVDTLRVPSVKLASGEITNGPLLMETARSQVPVIMSTGMSEPAEIQTALEVLAFGYTCPNAPPSGEAFRKAWQTDESQSALRQRVTLLHCTTEYPAPIADAHLRAMDDLRDRFGLPVGLSDHTSGIAVALAAAAREAAIIEKHFTLDRTLPGPDHQASLEPDELKSMVEGIRTVAAALGSSAKGVAASERRNKPVARRSLIATQPIAKGEAYSKHNLGAKRPGTGVSPMRYWEYLGRPADRDYDTDDLILPIEQGAVTA